MKMNKKVSVIFGLVAFSTFSFRYSSHPKYYDKKRRMNYTSMQAI